MGFTPEQFEEFRGFVKDAKRPLIFFDDDGDGTTSFTMLYHALGAGNGVPVKSGPEVTDFFLRKVEEYRPDVIFVLDKPMVSDEFIDAVKVDLFPDEVFVFSPRGDVYNLPRRATPIDFAYAVHSEVGDQCAGAKVNGKMVPLRHRLVDGDTVEITTSRRQSPRRDWLEFVVSGKADRVKAHGFRYGSFGRRGTAGSAKE